MTTPACERSPRRRRRLPTSTEAAAQRARDKVRDRLRRALRPKGPVRDVIAETLLECIPEGAAYRGAAIMAVETFTDLILDRIRPVLMETTVPPRYGGQPAEAATSEPDPDGLTNEEQAELERAEAAARFRLFDMLWRAESRKEPNEVAFVSALVRSARAPVRRPGVLLTAYRWGLLRVGQRLREQVR